MENLERVRHLNDWKYDDRLCLASSLPVKEVFGGLRDMSKDPCMSDGRYENVNFHFQRKITDGIPSIHW